MSGTVGLRGRADLGEGSGGGRPPGPQALRSHSDMCQALCPSPGSREQTAQPGAGAHPRSPASHGQAELEPTVSPPSPVRTPSTQSGHRTVTRRALSHVCHAGGCEDRGEADDGQHTPPPVTWL